MMAGILQSRVALMKKQAKEAEEKAKFIKDVTETAPHEIFREAVADTVHSLGLAGTGTAGW